MKNLLLVGLISCLVACGGSDKNNNVSDTELQQQNITRNELDGLNYTLALPEGGVVKGKAYKLLLAFHGSGGTDGGMQRIAGFEKYSDDYIVVYPKSQQVEWEEGCECNVAHRLGSRDVELVVALINEMHEQYNIIDGENYAVGFSQGGLFSQNMLCKHSELFKAVATVAAPMSKQLHLACRVSDPTNYMLVQGTNDQVLPYYGNKEKNFGLISANHAVSFIAHQTMESPIKNEQSPRTGVSETIYTDELGRISKLVSISGGGHYWSFQQYNTSKHVLDFFNQSSDYSMSEDSSLYSLESGNYHVRSMGQQGGKGDVIILSGANKFFHSDSAWASLVQPLLAKHARVHVIDRLGNAWSSNIEEPSFKQLAEDLPELLGLLGSQKVTFLSFANSNLATLMYLNHPNPEIEVKGMVWADPDILLPHSIMQYQSGAVAGLRKYKNEYIEHVSEGNWTEKSVERIAIERAEVAELIPSSHQDKMDWVYYDKVTELRLDVAKQVTRIKEMMNYHDDLNLAEPLQHNINVPISVIDSDFERLDIANATEEEKPSLIKWQQEGTQWSKEIANKTQGKYYELKNASHQVFFEHPDTVLKATLEVLERND